MKEEIISKRRIPGFFRRGSIGQSVVYLFGALLLGAAGFYIGHFSESNSVLRIEQGILLLLVAAIVSSIQGVTNENPLIGVLPSLWTSVGIGFGLAIGTSGSLWAVILSLILGVFLGLLGFLAGVFTRSNILEKELKTNTRELYMITIIMILAGVLIPLVFPFYP